jgi:hydrogenase nickel incorporation protein HypB
MFRSCDLCVVSKIDLLPALDFDMELLERNIRAANPGLRLMKLSAKTGEGVGEWLDWLRSLSASKKRV